MSTSLTELFGTDHPVALVTGSGADRVGRAIARHLADCGYDIVLHAHRSLDDVRTTCQAWQNEGIRASYVSGAVDDRTTVDGWCKEIEQRHGGLHVVVNSAAVWQPGRLEELDEDRLLEQWRVNLMGPALVCRAAGLMMADQSHGGAIVNIGDWALVRPYIDFSAYLLSKGSIDTLTQMMAVELGERNPRIRVNAIMPGPVLLDAAIGPEARQKIIDQSLLKREGSPQDVAQAARFLVESPFVTGVCLPVDGGRTIWAGRSHDVVAHPTYEPQK